MGAQGLDTAIAARQFGVAHAGVDFFVALMMQKHRRPFAPAFGLGDQMMQALRHIGGKCPQTQRTDRIAHNAAGTGILVIKAIMALRPIAV